jgi:hypothetical protein
VIRLFEKLVYEVITPIIRPSISDEQHGFFCGRSTVFSLVEVSNFGLSEMEDGLQASRSTRLIQIFQRLSIE